MYQELMFTSASPSLEDGIAGGPARLPPDIAWPTDAEGMPLSHLLSLPGSWFSPALADTGYQISVFIPYTQSDVSHYRKLRAVNGQSEAVVLGYVRSSEERQHASEIEGCGRIHVCATQEPDDDDNLASKLDGVDAWLQARLSVLDCTRRLSIYGADLDLSLPGNKGILSDGMGYLFLRDDFIEHADADIGAFFLQLG